jgi:hypothetical protein
MGEEENRGRDPQRSASVLGPGDRAALHARRRGQTPVAGALAPPAGAVWVKDREGWKCFRVSQGSRPNGFLYRRKPRTPVGSFLCRSDGSGQPAATSSELG